MRPCGDGETPASTLEIAADFTPHSWLGSTFTSLNSTDFVDIPLAIDPAAKAGFDPTKVSRIGIKLSTGSNASNTFSATTIELDSVVVE